jgi:uncharacterized membrane-anchored protein YjiN (DUF445 family)
VVRSARPREQAAAPTLATLAGGRWSPREDVGDATDRDDPPARSVAVAGWRWTWQPSRRGGTLSGSPPAETSFAEDRAKVRGLRRMKVLATSLLVLAAVIFVVARLAEPGAAWAGYVRATAEAAMVGALADWFAVTALFRHPLGLPIPHTAIIPTRKDQIGASLGRFVEDNFLDPRLLAERLGDARLAVRLANWLSAPANARTVGDQVAAVVRGVTEVLDDDLVQEGLEQVVARRLESVPLAALAGRALAFAVEGGHHHQVLESSLAGIRRFLNDHRATFRERLTHESPWWVPEAIDDRIFAKIYDGVNRFVDDVGTDRDHPLRRDLDARLAELAHRLATSEDLAARGEAIKAEVWDHPEVRAWVGDLWAHLKGSLVEAAEDPGSELRRRLERSLVDAGVTLSRDPALQERVDEWIISAVAYIGDQFRGEAAGLIATTVERWDARDTSRRIEVQVGRDLQFIRINGTIVGGLAGLVIHTFSHLVL